MALVWREGTAAVEQEPPGDGRGGWAEEGGLGALSGRKRFRGGTQTAVPSRATGYTPSTGGSEPRRAAPTVTHHPVCRNASADLGSGPSRYQLAKGALDWAGQRGSVSAFSRDTQFSGAQAVAPVRFFFF